jgi:methylmalonyl-CoA mutase, N-terminal domain
MRQENSVNMNKLDSSRIEPLYNMSGIEIKPLYGPEDVSGVDFETDTGRPGDFPYVRGVYPGMYRVRPWTIRQLGSLGPPGEANRRIRYLIGMGATGISICLDMPTIMGRDSDDPLAEGEVGRCGGVAVDTMEDMRDLLEGVDLEKISINFVSNSQSAVILAMFCTLALERGADWKLLSGTMQNDALKEYQAQKSYYFPPEPSIRLIMDTIAFCSRNLPKFNPISISGYHLASAGASPVQELAFTLANGLLYVEKGIEAGMAVDDFAPRLSFFFKVHNDLFENVAKFRAARRIWARAIRDGFGAENPASWRFRVHTQTSGSSLTAQQMENNIIRTTIQALSAVMAGTQSLHTNAHDEALSIPTRRSEKLALRTQQIILHESGAAATADPLAGSYYVEALTRRMEEAAGAILIEIRDMGGVLAGIDNGYFQREIAESAFRYQRSLERGDRIVVGLNRYVEEEETDIELREVDPEFEKNKIAALKRFKENRDKEQLRRRGQELRAVCESGENVLPVLISAVREGMSLGEAVAHMKEIFGGYREQAIF